MNEHMTANLHQNPEGQNLDCQTTRASFSGYLDGAVSGNEMREIASHLDACPRCHAEFSSWRSMQQTLASLRTAKVPEDLGLKLRVAISREKARHDRRWADVLSVRWENAIRPMLIQVSAGFAGTVVLVGSILFLFGLFGAPEPVMANDIPLGAMTSPHYLYSAANERPIVTDQDTTVVVEAAVNSLGQVYDYKIVSGPQSSEVQKQVAEQLMLSVYEPARVFGTPVRGRVVVTFAGISVRG
jgi:anti-sigma factor RsiW